MEKTLEYDDEDGVRLILDDTDHLYFNCLLCCNDPYFRCNSYCAKLNPIFDKKQIFLQCTRCNRKIMYRIISSRQTIAENIDKAVTDFIDKDDNILTRARNTTILFMLENKDFSRAIRFIHMNCERTMEMRIIEEFRSGTEKQFSYDDRAAYKEMYIELKCPCCHGNQWHQYRKMRFDFNNEIL